jgi:hypothetical protein
MTVHRASRILADERGVLLLIAMVTIALATLIGTATVVTIVSQSGGCSSVMQRLADNEPVSEEEIQRCRQALPTQFRTAVAGGSLLNAADAEPNLENVVGQYGSGAIGNMVDRGSTPAATSDNPLPPDVAAGGGPSCDTGPFTCNDGRTICAEQVCNGTANCQDGSDEPPAIDCGDQKTCCVVTDSCPGETGSSCASNCCCCPLNQVCSSNAIQGCVAASRQVSPLRTAGGHLGASKLMDPFLFY